MTKNKKIEHSDPTIQHFSDQLRKEGLTYDNTGAPMDFVSAVQKLSTVGSTLINEDMYKEKVRLVKSSRETNRKKASTKNNRRTALKLQEHRTKSEDERNKDFDASVAFYTQEHGMLTQRHNLRGKQYDEYLTKLEVNSLSDGEKKHMLELENEMEDIEKKQVDIKNAIAHLKALEDIEYRGLEKLTHAKPGFSTSDLYSKHTGKDGTATGEQRQHGKAQKSQARLLFEHHLETVGARQSEYLEAYKNYFAGKSIASLKWNTLLEGLGVRSKDKVKALEKQRRAYENEKDSLIQELKYDLVEHQGYATDQAERIAKKYIQKVLTIENISKEEEKIANLRKGSIDDVLASHAQQKEEKYNHAQGVEKAILWLERNKVRIGGKVLSGSIALFSGVGAGAWALRAIAGGFGGYYGGKLGRMVGQKLGKKFFNTASGPKVEKIIALYTQGRISISQYQRKLKRLGLNANRVTALCAIAGGVGGALGGAKLEGIGYDVLHQSSSSDSLPIEENSEKEFHRIPKDDPQEHAMSPQDEKEFLDKVRHSYYHQEEREGLHEQHTINDEQRSSSDTLIKDETVTEGPDTVLATPETDPLTTLTITVKEGKGLISLFQDAHNKLSAEYIHDGSVDVDAPEGVKNFLSKSPVQWAQESGGYNVSADASGGNGLESILVQKGATLEIDTHTGSIVFHNGADTQIIEDGDVSTPVTTLEGKFMDTNHSVDTHHTSPPTHATIDREGSPSIESSDTSITAGKSIKIIRNYSLDHASASEHYSGTSIPNVEHVDPKSVFSENTDTAVSNVTSQEENFNDLTSTLAETFSIHNAEAYSEYMKNIFTAFHIYDLDVIAQEQFARTYTAVVDNLFGYDLPTGEHVSGFESNTWFNIKGASLAGIFKTIDDSFASGKKVSDSAYMIHEFFRNDPDVRAISYIQHPPATMSLETACARLALGEK